MKNRKYSHIFFDLDHTLWDFEANSHETLAELYEEFELHKLGAPGINIFLDHYYERNAWCWAQYRAGLMDKETLRVIRFTYLLGDYHIDNKKLEYALADEYLARSPYKRNLIPHAIEALDYLHKKYPLHLITNGFQEVQDIKLKKSGLGKYFKTVTTSEMAGALKPDPVIFSYSLQRAGATPGDSIYIGDHLETDMKGALGAGLDQVFFNPDNKTHELELTFEISSLKELIRIF